MSDLIDRQAAINIVEYFPADSIEELIEKLPSVKPEIVMCKDCKKHNVSVGYQEDCCPLYEFRGMSYGHEHDYQFCCFAERRTDELRSENSR